MTTSSYINPRYKRDDPMYGSSKGVIMLNAYITAALWSSTDDDGEPLDRNYTVADLAPETLAAATADCERFKQVAGQLIYGWSDEQLGHDLWLTRCGHGTGFWDREGMPHRDELTALVGFGTRFPPLDLYVGDNGLIYGM